MSKVDAKWLNEIHKRFGESVLMPASQLKPRGYRGSGSLSLDIALGGGWGRRTEVRLQGKEGSGKTLLFDMAAIEAQRRENKKSLMIDFEGTYDINRHIALGGDPNMMHVINHENVKEPMLFLEAAFDILKVLLVHSDDYACICFDSTGAMVSRAEYESKMEYGQEKATPFHTARGMAEGVKIVNGLLYKAPSEPTVFFVSQGRDNIGAQSFKGMPPADKQTGGRALPYFSSTIVEVRKGEITKGDVEDDSTGRKETDIEVGHKTLVKVRKNKLNGVQGRTAEFLIYTLGGVIGIDRVDELVDLAIFTQVIKQSGSWFDFEDIGVGLNFHLQGKLKVKEALKDEETFKSVDILTRRKLAESMDTSKAPDDEDTESEDE